MRCREYIAARHAAQLNKERVEASERRVQNMPPPNKIILPVELSLIFALYLIGAIGDGRVGGRK